MNLVLLYCLAIAIGFISYYFAVGLDSMMDWGSIFYKYRYNKFLKYAKDNNNDLITKSALVHTMEAKEGELKLRTRIDYMAGLYWELATYVPKFKLYICPECMSVRIASYLNIFITLFIYLFLGSSLFIFLNLPFTLMVSISIIYFNIRANG